MAEGADAELEPSDESGRRSVDELIPPDASAIGDDLLSLFRAILGTQQRSPSPAPEPDHEKENELIFDLQQVVYLAVRNGCQKPIEIAADEMRKRWKYFELLDFDDFDDQVRERKCQNVSGEVREGDGRVSSRYKCEEVLK